MNNYSEECFFFLYRKISFDSVPDGAERRRRIIIIITKGEDGSFSLLPLAYYWSRNYTIRI